MLLEVFAQLPEKIADQEVWLAFAGPDESGMRRGCKNWRERSSSPSGNFQRRAL
jgi:hypothetical protein